MKKLILILIILAMQNLFAVPAWYRNPNNHIDTSVFLIGIGEAVTLEQATSVAKSDLIQKISVTVRSDSETSYISIETESKSYYKEHINQNIKTSSEHQIVGMEVVNQAKVKNIWYVMVSLNRERLLSILLSEISELSNNIQRSYDDAERFKKNGQIVFALEKYFETQTLLLEVLSKIFLYEGLSSRQYTSRSMVKVSDVENSAKDLITSVTLSIISGNNQIAVKNELLPQAIVFETKINRTLSINLPVIISYGNGRVIENGVTDNNGKYSIHTLAIPEIDNRGRIKLQLDISKFPEFYRKMLNDKMVIANYTANDPLPLEFSISVKDSKGVNIHSINSHISLILSNNKIIVKNNAQMQIRAVVTITNKNQIERNGRTVHNVNIALDIDIYDTMSNKVVGVYRTTEFGQSTQSENEALIQVYQKVKVEEKRFVEILNQADNLRQK